MPSQSRQPLLAILVVLLPILLVVGLWLGGHPEDLPSFARSTFVADHATRVVDEAIDRISNEYYRPISKVQLSNASIAGVVASLGDRFSHYLSPSEFREFNSPPSFTGIGVSVGPERRGLLIARVFNSSPAARAGLKPGDVILAVDGHKLEGLNANAAVALIKGLPGTDVELVSEAPRGQHATGGVTRTMKITRATISEPVVASTTKTIHGIKLGVVALATFSPG